MFTAMESNNQIPSYLMTSHAYLPFMSMGSGCMNCLAVLETKYKDDMSEAEAVAVLTEAIEAGIYHDLGSGSNVDITVITKDGARITRGVKCDNKKMNKKKIPYFFKPNNTRTDLPFFY